MPRPHLRINNAFHIWNVGTDTEILFHVQTPRAQFCWIMCWKVTPINIQTTGKGHCDWFVMSAMCVATSMPVFYSCFTHPTSPRMLSLFPLSTSSQTAPPSEGKADSITARLKTFQWHHFSLRIKCSGHLSSNSPLTQWVPTSLDS